MKYTIVCDGEEKKNKKEVEIRLKHRSGWIEVQVRFAKDFWYAIASFGYGNSNFTEVRKAVLEKYGFSNDVQVNS